MDLSCSVDFTEIRPSVAVSLVFLVVCRTFLVVLFFLNWCRIEVIRRQYHWVSTISLPWAVLQREQPVLLASFETVPQETRPFLEGLWTIILISWGFGGIGRRLPPKWLPMMWCFALNWGCQKSNFNGRWADEHQNPLPQLGGRWQFSLIEPGCVNFYSKQRNKSNLKETTQSPVITLLLASPNGFLSTTEWNEISTMNEKPGGSFITLMGSMGWKNVQSLTTFPGSTYP